jgi:hypothetical protein
VDNKDMEVPYLLPTIDREGSGPTMDDGIQKMEALRDLFEKIIKLRAQLATSRALVEEYKAKIEKLELDNMEKQNIINVLCGSSH